MRRAAKCNGLRQRAKSNETERLCQLERSIADTHPSSEHFRSRHLVCNAMMGIMPASSRSTLTRYAEMRDFSQTPEPPPEDTQRSGPLTFTIQKHAARRLHYDLRLEIGGALVSWPIPQGPS